MAEKAAQPPNISIDPVDAPHPKPQSSKVEGSISVGSATSSVWIQRSVRKPAWHTDYLFIYLFLFAPVKLEFSDSVTLRT